MLSPREEIVCVRAELWKFDSRAQCSKLCSGNFSRSLEEGGHVIFGGVSGGSEEKGTFMSPRGLGGCSRAGDGGRNGWEFWVQGTPQAKARPWESLGPSEGMTCVLRAWGVGRGRDRIWQERKVGPQHGDSPSLQGGTPYHLFVSVL